MPDKFFSDGDLESQGLCLGDVDRDEWVFYSCQDWPFQPLVLWPGTKDACKTLDMGLEGTVILDAPLEAAATISVPLEASATLGLEGDASATIDVGPQPSATLDADACEVF